MNFFNELKRRNVFRVGIAYSVAAWVLLQMADLVLESIDAPGWVLQAMMLVVALGFIASIIIAWAYELTPEGIKRERDVSRGDSVTHETGRKLNRITMGFLIIAVAFFAVDKYMLNTGSRPDQIKRTVVEPVPSGSVETGPDAAGKEPLPETAAKGPSIAVLPFVNMSDDPAQVYFSDGISEELLNVLTRVDGLSVASRTSSFAFRDQAVGLTEIARKLKVGYVLEGSVRKAGERVRITAQLINTANDRHLWSDTYDRSLADIFAVQSEIANEIASALGGSLGLAGQTVTVAPKTDNLSAYDLYLRGRSAWLYRTVSQDVENAIDYLKRALELDPGFLDAKELLAAAWLTLPFWTEQQEPVEVFEARAVALAQEVLAEDPNRVLALVSLAESLPLDTERGWVPYKELYERALKLEPDNTTALHWLGLMYQDLGYPERAIPLHEKCIELDPGYTNCHAQLIQSLDLAGEGRKADIMYGENASRVEDLLTRLDLDYALEFENFKLAAVILRELPYYEGAPGTSLFEFLANPDMDPQPVLKQWEQWASENDKDLTNNITIMAILGEFDRVDLSYWTGGDVFSPLFTAYRRSPQFKAYARESGLYATWKHLGFPRWCRAVGEGDFECD